MGGLWDSDPMEACPKDRDKDRDKDGDRGWPAGVAQLVAGFPDPYFLMNAFTRPTAFTEFGAKGCS
jgi:hypothetical protein